MSEPVNMVEQTQAEDSLAQMVAMRAKLMPHDTAIIFHDQLITYAQLDERANRLATAFLNMGLTNAERIAVILPTRPEFLYIWLAASKIGAAVVGLNYRYREDEITYMVNNSRPSVMICINQFAGVDYGRFLEPLRKDLPSVEKYVFLGPSQMPGALDFDQLLAQEVDQTALGMAMGRMDPAADNFIIYTSGTTGRPKGAVLTQKSIMAMIRPWAVNLGIGRGEMVFCVLPLNHVGGGTILALTTLASGGVLVLHDVFAPDQVLEIFKRLPIAIFGAVPTIHAILLTIPGADAAVFANLRLAMYGGAAASPTLLAKLDQVVARGTIVACYGASEVSGFCTYTSPDDPKDKILGTVGRAPAEFMVRVVDPLSKAELAQGQVGEVAVKGALLVDRYLDMPEETAAAFRDGWFFTGDMGALDSDGYLTLLGRFKEMYITGGFNVYPKEVEDTLMSYPGVGAAAVVCVPDEIKGEIGFAFVVPSPGGAVSAEEIMDHCRAKLADYKVPRGVSIEKELPMTPLGKLHKTELRKMAELLLP